MDLKLDLPQVAVVGSQSSGKSSVLEALVSGIDTSLTGALALQLLRRSIVVGGALSLPEPGLPPMSFRFGVVLFSGYRTVGKSNPW